MRALPSKELPSLVAAFSSKDLGGDLPHPDVGFELISPDEDGGDLWHSLLSEYNELVAENQRYVIRSLASSCETGIAALIADYSVVQKDVVQQEPVVEIEHFEGDVSLVMGKGGSLKIPQAWRNMMDHDDCYMIFDEKSGQILVMNQDDIDEKVIAQNLQRLRGAYKERGIDLPRMAHYTPYPYYRHIAAGGEKGARIDPQVFNWTAIAQDEAFDTPFEVLLKGHGSYFSIERADGGWKVPAEQLNKLRNAMVSIARKAVEARDPLSGPEQNQIAPVSGGVSDAHPQELTEPS